MLTNHKTIHVEWGDCDPAGIVYYPRYFAWFDNCTAALFEAAGLPKHQMLKAYGIVGIPMVDTRARRSSFDVQHKLYKGSTLAVECSETRVWAVRSKTDSDAIEGQSVPADVIARFGAPQKR